MSSDKTHPCKRTGKGLLAMHRRNNYILKEEAEFVLGLESRGSGRKRPTRDMELMKISGNV